MLSPYRGPIAAFDSHYFFLSDPQLLRLYSILGPGLMTDDGFFADVGFAWFDGHLLFQIPSPIFGGVHENNRRAVALPSGHIIMRYSFDWHVVFFFFCFFCFVLFGVFSELLLPQ